jgi:hypothetical protein
MRGAQHNCADAAWDRRCDNPVHKIPFLLLSKQIKYRHTNCNRSGFCLTTFDALDTSMANRLTSDEKIEEPIAQCVFDDPHAPAIGCFGGRPETTDLL